MPNKLAGKHYQADKLATDSNLPTGRQVRYKKILDRTG